jgi:putative ABC transport system permease protein
LLKSREDVITETFFEPDEDFESKTTDDEKIEKVSGLSSYYLVYFSVAGLMLLFMLLPSINLVNINLSRMIERNSEIGVRKAFGASRKVLVGQFITENLILTLIGGILSIILAFITISIINSSGLIPYSNLTLNVKVFVIGFVLCIVFGFISGVYPAYRMSKLHPVDALRGGSR